MYIDKDEMAEKYMVNLGLLTQRLWEILKVQEDDEDRAAMQAAVALVFQIKRMDEQMFGKNRMLQ